MAVLLDEGHPRSIMPSFAERPITQSHVPRTLVVLVHRHGGTRITESKLLKEELQAEGLFDRFAEADTFGLHRAERAQFLELAFPLDGSRVKERDVAGGRAGRVLSSRKIRVAEDMEVILPGLVVRVRRPLVPVGVSLITNSIACGVE